LLLTQFLVAMESSIVGTSIETITGAIGSTERAQLVFTMYLVSYASFILLIGKISDVLGRRATFLASTFIFTIFSIACGASQTMVQLIIFRSFQGLGASGIQAITIIIIPDLIPHPKMLSYSSMVAMTMIGGLLIGLFLGGWISTEGAWRWCFYVNGPFGLTALVATLALPWNHPPRVTAMQKERPSIVSGLARIDWIGCFLFVLGSVPLLFALIEAEVLLAWTNGAIIACLIISGSSYIALFFHQWWLYKRLNTSINPLIPIELFTKRYSAALLISSFWFGFPYYGIMLMLPKRFQLINSSSPVNAAMRTLPMLAVVPFVIIAVNVALGKTKLSPFYVLIGCTAAQIISVSILATVPSQFPTGFYVVVALIGCGNGPYLGVGFRMMGAFVRMRTKVDGSDALGLLNQMRILGGAIGLAISARLLTSHVVRSGSDVLSQEVRSQLARTPEILFALPTTAMRASARELLNGGFNYGFIFHAGAAAISFLALFTIPRAVWKAK
ncbi:MFS general substrate transporter, partial [Polyplosphaeria fusca]